MANWFEPTEQQQAEWEEWVASTPAAIRALTDRLTPWGLYRMPATDQIVTLYSYSEPEDGGRPTVTVNVIGSTSPVMMPAFGVFGVSPDDLVPYEPRTKGELEALAARAAA